MKNTVAITASGQAITAGRGTISRIIVGTHSSGVIRLTDSPSGAAGRVILTDYTLPTGSSVIDLGGIEFYEGVYFTLVSGSATIQLVTNLG